MNAASPPDVSLRPRLKLWPAFFAGLLIIINGIALAILYADVTLRVDGQPTADSVRGAFLSMTKLNLLLGSLSLVCLFFAYRAKKPLSSGSP